jgi:flagellum-specific ATP synthase
MSGWQDAATHRLQVASMGARLGRIEAFNGLVIEAHGPDARLGELCHVESRYGSDIPAEVIGFRDGRVLLMPYGHVHGISADGRVRASGRSLSIPVGSALLGRVVDAFGTPLDRKGPIAFDDRYPIYRDPINPLDRAPITEALDTGVRAIDAFLTLGAGQRIGIFAGSGVGKSTLLGMLARRVEADVIVLALVGERGREVGDFLRDSLGEAGLARSVLVVATSDAPALVRTHAAHAAHAIAEYFRDLGKSVLLVIDSMTRFAMAQREIGLAAGEPPTFRGYTPSVFAQLPRLLERCGRIEGSGAITGIYSVLVEGDDTNEPVTDHMRAILDGHVMLSRDLAARGHHPAIDILHSASRLMGHVASREAQDLATAARRLFATHAASRDLLELGAYQSGGNPGLDRAIAAMPALDALLQQRPDEHTSRHEAVAQLRRALADAEVLA